MHQFDALLEVAEKLNGPGGCPWDQSQNFFSLQPYVLEEAHEVLEAVDSQDDQKITEELGDLLYTVIFYCKVAAKEGRFSIKDVLESVQQKLIRRHPHVFGEVKVSGAEEVLANWEHIKKGEKGSEGRKSALDGIPKDLPLLARAQKMIQKMKRTPNPVVGALMGSPSRSEPQPEAHIGQALLELIAAAEASKIDAESALRRALKDYEQKFRSWEALQNF